MLPRERTGDGQSEAVALRAGVSGIETHRARTGPGEIRLRHARSCVVNLDAQQAAPAAAADQHPATVGVLDRIGDEVVDDAHQHQRLDLRLQRRGDVAQFQTLLLRVRQEHLVDGLQNLADTELFQFAGVAVLVGGGTGDRTVQMPGDQLLEISERILDPLAAVGIGIGIADQPSQVEAECMEGLVEIVDRVGELPALAVGDVLRDRILLLQILEAPVEFQIVNGFGQARLERGLPGLPQLVEIVPDRKPH